MIEDRIGQRLLTLHPLWQFKRDCPADTDKSLSTVYLNA